jgi:protein SCO1/2
MARAPVAKNVRLAATPATCNKGYLRSGARFSRPRREERSMSWAKTMVFAAAAVASLAVAFYAIDRYEHRATDVAASSIVGDGVAPTASRASSPVPDFALVDQSGVVVTKSALLGRPWIANVIFTRCTEMCPMLTSKLGGLRERFTTDAMPRFVSLSSDPEFDTPAVLRAFAAKYHVDERQWSFLTGPKPQIERLVMDGFHLAVGDRPDYHSGRFVLVDAAGVPRGTYNSDDYEALQKLVADAKALLQAGPNG